MRGVCSEGLLPPGMRGEPAGQLVDGIGERRELCGQCIPRCLVASQVLRGIPDITGDFLQLILKAPDDQKRPGSKKEKEDSKWREDVFYDFAYCFPEGRRIGAQQLIFIGHHHGQHHAADQAGNNQSTKQSSCNGSHRADLLPKKYPTPRTVWRMLSSPASANRRRRREATASSAFGVTGSAAL